MDKNKRDGKYNLYIHGCKKWRRHSLRISLMWAWGLARYFEMLSYETQIRQGRKIVYTTPSRR